jgi:hypothetical protein
MSDGAPACANGMVDVFSRIGDQARAQKWELIRQSGLAPASMPKLRQSPKCDQSGLIPLRV